MHWPYLGSYVMISVKECHDIGCRCVYLVGGCCVAGEYGCVGLSGLGREVYCGVVT